MVPLSWTADRHLNFGVDPQAIEMAESTKVRNTRDSGPTERIGGHRLDTAVRARPDSQGGRSTRGLGLPLAVVAEQSVDEREQLAHECDEGDLALAALG